MEPLLPIGAPAPAFSAPASDGTTYTLADLVQRGPLVLFFYPGNNTPGCNRQLSAARDAMASFERAGVLPLGVNPASAKSHATYAAKLALGFPLLSDPDRSIARAYGALKDDGKRIQRTVYGIGRDGTIAFAVRGAPQPAEIVAALAAR